MKNKLRFIIAILALLTFNNLVMGQLPLNTGYNHDTQSVYPAGATDSFWIIISNPAGAGTVPRVSNVISAVPGWKPPIGPLSQWITYNATGRPGVIGDYVYQKCFCLKRGFGKFPESAILDVSVRADDAFKLYLNSSPVLLANSSTSGVFNSVNPAQLILKGSDLIKYLKVGNNCLQVKVSDTARVITGFNLAGSISAVGIDGVAKGANPKTQYDGCSSCGKKKYDVKDLQMDEQ